MSDLIIRKSILMVLALSLMKVHAQDIPVNVQQWEIGGWADLLMMDRTGDDDYVNVPHLYLYGDFQINDRFRSMAEIRYANPPGSDDETSVERLYLEYRHGIPLKIRLGRFNTPAGLWQQMHWSFTVDSTEKPIIERQNLFPTQSDGIEVHGKTAGTQWEWDYSVFAGAGGNNREEQELKGVGYGLDISATLRDIVRLGAFFHGFENKGSTHDPFPGERDVFLAYSEATFYQRRLLFRAEYLTLKREGLGTSDGYYAKLKWSPHRKWYLNFRYDSADELHQTSEPMPHRSETATLGFWPSNQWRVRLEHAHHKMKNSEHVDATHWSIWMGYSF